MGTQLAGALTQPRRPSHRHHPSCSKDFIKPRARAAPMLCVLRNTLWLLGGQVEIAHTDIVLGELGGGGQSRWLVFIFQAGNTQSQACCSPCQRETHASPSLTPSPFPPIPLPDDIWSLDLNKLDGWRCVKENSAGGWMLRCRGPPLFRARGKSSTRDGSARTDEAGGTGPAQGAQPCLHPPCSLALRVRVRRPTSPALLLPHPPPALQGRMPSRSWTATSGRRRMRRRTRSEGSFDLWTVNTAAL